MIRYCKRSATSIFRATSAFLAFLLASPAFAQSPFPTTVSTKSVAIAISSATTTELIPAVTNQSVGITAINVVASGAGNFKLVYGTGTNCGTEPPGLTGYYPLTTTAGIAMGSGIGLLLLVPRGNAVCAVTSAAVTISGFISYTQF